jgi:hypothetical protein
MRHRKQRAIREVVRVSIAGRESVPVAVYTKDRAPCKYVEPKKETASK